MVAGPVSPEIGVELGIVPGLADHAVEEEGEVESFPVGGEVETADELRLVRTHEDSVLCIDDIVTVCIDISESSNARSSVLNLIAAHIFVHFSLCAEETVSLVAEP